MNELDRANLRYAEAAVMEQRIKDRRRHDKRRTYMLVVWLAITTIFWAGAIVKLAHQGRDLGRVVEQQRSGRAVAIDALCGAVSGVVDAGRATILQSAGTENRFTRRLERLGYPPRPVREAQARLAARDYGAAIAAAVERTTGSRHLARSDGTLDCSGIKHAANAGARGSPG